MKAFTLLLALLTSTTVFAAFNFTISGRIQNPDGTQLSAPAVNFKVQVRSPNSDNCLLFEEVITVPNVTNGDFTLKVGTGTRSAATVDGGLPLATVLKNDKTLNLAAATTPCVGAVTTYTPLSSDNRKVYLSFNDGSANGPQTIGTIDMNWTALAVYADRANSTSQLQNTPVSTAAPALNQVLQFDGTNWTPTTLAGGGTLAIAGGGTGATTAPAALNNLLPSQASNTGKVLGTDGTNASWVSALTNVLPSAQLFVGSAGNIATAVSMSGDATLANSGALTLANSGVTAGTSTKVTYDAKGRVTAGAALASTDIPALDASKITTGTLPITLGGTGAVTANAALNNILPTQTANATKFLQTDGTNASWVSGNVGTVTNVTGTAPISVATGTSTPVVSIATANTTTTGALTSADWNIFNGKLGSSLTSGNIFVGSAGNVATGVAVSGDATLSNAGALTLAASGVTAGTAGSATAVPSLTVDAKGRVTAISSQAYADATGASKGIIQVGTNLSSTAGVISLTSAGVTGALTYTPVSNVLTSGNIFVGSAGNVATGVTMSGDATISNAGALSLSTSGVTAGTYNSVTVDVKGRATAGSNVANALNANLTLSNLSGPTSISQNLMPSASVTYDMGAFANRWNGGFFNQVNVNSIVAAGAASFGGTVTVTDQIQVGRAYVGDTTLTSPSGQASPQAMVLSTGAAGGVSPQLDLHLFTITPPAGNNSNRVVIETGNATGTNNSGDIVLYTGTVGTGTKGQVSVQAANLNMNSSKIVGLADPTAPQEASTKAYVDSKVGGAKNIVFSTNSGSFATTSVAEVDVTGLTVTITTTGRPVFIGLTGAGTTVGSYISTYRTAGFSGASFNIYRGATAINKYRLYIDAGSTTSAQNMAPPGSVMYIDTPVAGTYTYKLTVSSDDVSMTTRVGDVKLVAYEL